MNFNIRKDKNNNQKCGASFKKEMKKNSNNNLIKNLCEFIFKLQNQQKNFIYTVWFVWAFVFCI